MTTGLVLSAYTRTNTSTLDMNTFRRLLPLSIFALCALAIGCNKDGSDSGSGSGEANKPTGPCAGASEGLSGIAILEVKDTTGGAKLVGQLADELAAECVAKGYDKSATDTLGCYEKNKKAAGYRVMKGCDEKVGRELIDAVLEKHGGKKPKE
ncbi:MAG: hypothetical protein HOW73_19075 [Polyangiaceae bacterium]|nr:hypothetical protein [Polyangiaceae bacterium]